ncbi:MULTISPECIES: cytochrome c-type biogenesis protein CcmH [Buttiauxella]|jgi:cytochrome c-type biogenesis protein CcmH|uniref:Cytochrome c-type biogenesis protein n=3 Tax=Buttiauxella TaxID=82976 RepID=A0ABX2W8B7_9ENTR|nr:MULTISPECIES: cytochrome c-type biogenesis protein CcmH [Buttiauxella]AYN29469.1 cytochrome c biogenesis protein CcmH [Buttiauxella sp. 3AFRM03]OAT27515.1 cytochrome c heme lyase subunit [Buttiauxella ferragutiae ATCC 51602]TDN55381.1 cytochrome c-type biogenesis protein CcmH [Buttiauxella sp. JUb87]UNK62601.1 cytochrome c-type biogenesis protein CcmH [Buttiauxella ferragutiae]
MKRGWLILIAFLFSFNVLAAIDTFQFKDEAQEQQFRQLTEQLRCPKCQNNSIADSNAMIASDMRLKVYELQQQGKTKQQIIDYMVERYGNFVTYEPPMTPATLILWVLPVLFVLGGAGVIVRRSRKRRVHFSDEPEKAALPTVSKKAHFWFFAPGAVILLVVSSGVYLKTSDIKQVRAWQKVSNQTPQLLQRALDPQARPLNMPEMANLGLGLRTQLQHEPNNIEGWMMLGRIGMVLNNASTATQAFAHAYKLSPTNDNVKLGYAEVLTRSGDPQDNQLGGDLLRELLKSDHTNVRVLSLLAFNAFEQQHYSEAIGAWQIMLRVLPANDSRRAVVQRSIEQATAALAGGGGTKPESVEQQ